MALANNAERLNRLSRLHPGRRASCSGENLFFSDPSCRVSVLACPPAMGFWLAVAKRIRKEIALILGRGLTRAAGKYGLKGFGGAGVLEIVEDNDGDSYRAIYTVKFVAAVYVLHAFQQKAKRGRITPKEDIDLVKRRLRVARERNTSRW